MPIDFTVNGPNGQSGVIGAQQIQQQLHQHGFNPQGVSSDGMHITMADQHGTYEVPTQQVLQKLGWQVNEMHPQNADYDNVKPEWRAAVNGLPDDMMRKAYIEGTMRKLGVEQPQVMGQGRDWYVFNPATSQYIAVTNSPGLNTGDLAEGGMEGLRMAGSIAGGIGGAALGGGTPLSIAGAGAGAGLGGGVVDTAERAGLAAIDPVYADVAKQHLGSMAADVGGKALADTVGTAAFAGLPAVAGLVSAPAKNIARTLAEHGPMTTAARGVGLGMEGAGSLAEKVGGAFAKQAPEQAGGTGAAQMGKDLTREFAVMGDPMGVWGGIPGLGTAESAGWMAQIPEAATKAVPKGLNYGAEMVDALNRHGMQAAKSAGESQGLYGGMTAEEGSQLAGNYGIAPKMRDLSSRLTRPRNPVAAEEAGGSPLAERMAQRLKMGNGGKVPQGPRPYNPTSDITGNAAEMFGNQFGPNVGAAAGHMGESAGDIFQAAGTAGRGLVAASQGVFRAGAHTAHKLGWATKQMGRGLQAVGTVGQPLENQIYARYLAEENLHPMLSELLDPLRRRKDGDRINEATPTLAGN